MNRETCFSSACDGLLPGCPFRPHADRALSPLERRKIKQAIYRMDRYWRAPVRHRAQGRKRYNDNKEAEQERSLAYYRANRDEVNSKVRARRRDNRDEINQARREKYAQNRDEENRKLRARRARHKESLCRHSAGKDKTTPTSSESTLP